MSKTLSAPPCGLSYDATLQRYVDADTIDTLVDRSVRFDLIGSKADLPDAGSDVVVHIPQLDAPKLTARVFALMEGNRLQGAPPCGWTFRGRLVGCTGGMAEVAVQRKFRIRLDECWAPETHETRIKGEKQLGLKMLAKARRLVPEGSQVRIWIPGNHELLRVTTMSRFLGRVYHQGKDLSAEWCRRKMAAPTKKALYELMESLGLDCSKARRR